MAGETTLTSDTIEVREAHRFDIAALERYLSPRIPGFGGPVTVRQFQGGQSNPTYYLGTRDGEYVLRRKPPGKLLPSAHAVDREYRILTALGRTDVPVPKTYVLCEDAEVIGTAFYVMDWVRGRIMVDPLLPGLTPPERSAIYDSERRAGAAAPRGLAGARAGGFRKAGQLLRAAVPSLEPAVSRLRDGAHRGDGAVHGVATRSHSVRRPDHYRPRRLPAGQRHHPPVGTSCPRRARLGDLDPRPPPGRSRVQRHVLSPRARHPGRRPRAGSQGARHPHGRGVSRRALSPHGPQRHSRLELLRRLLDVPPRRHRAGHHGARDRGDGQRRQCPRPRRARAPDGRGGLAPGRAAGPRVSFPEAAR